MLSLSKQRMVWLGVLLLGASTLSGCQSVLDIPNWELDQTLDCQNGSCVCVDNLGDCDGDASNGCEASLMSTAHCGACGRTCLGGGCVRFECQPYNLIELGDAAFRVEVSGTDLAVGTLSGLVRVPRAGNLTPKSFEILTNRSLVNFALGHGRAFVALWTPNDTGDILEIPWDGLPVWKSVVSWPIGMDVETQLEVGDRCLFVSKAKELVGFDLQTRQMVPIASNIAFLRGGGGCILYQALDSGTIYQLDQSPNQLPCGTSKLLYKIDPQTESLLEMTCDSALRIPYMTLSPADSSPIRILRFSSDTQPPELVATTNPPMTAFRLKVWNGQLYWSNDAAIHHWDDTRNVGEQDELIVQDGSFAFAADDLQTYWARGSFLLAQAH